MSLDLRLFHLIQHLSPTQKIKLMAFVGAMQADQTPALASGLLRFAGAIPLDDLQKMETAIEEGCSQIDADGW